MCFILLVDLDYFTIALVLGVLVDMHNGYLSFCFLARNISVITLICPSESALLQGKLIKLKSGVVVSCFPA